jgi:hypothetical protein
VDQDFCVLRDCSISGLTDGRAPGLEPQYDSGTSDRREFPYRHGCRRNVGSPHSDGAPLKLAPVPCAGVRYLVQRIRATSGVPVRN